MALLLFTLAGTLPLFAATDNSEKATGSLTVKIKPAEARHTGGCWRVDDGSWHKSGQTVSGLATGRHTVSFKAISGWTAPHDKQVRIVKNEISFASGKYVASLSGSISTTITSQSAIDAGAMWRVDDGPWHASGETAAGLSLGAHTVSFKDVAGWVTPEPQMVDVFANQTTDVYGDYTFETQTTVILPGNVPLELVWIPAGSFMMGAYANEQDSQLDEVPQHQVTFATGFWMGKYEVTKAQWQAVMNTTPWSGQTHIITDGNSPAVYISWDDSKAFIAALNTYTGLTFRLPSESEWEYACRAGTATRFYWGDDASYTLVGNYAWYYGNCVSEQYAHVVGQKLPNAWGLYDMSGNVWEWCEDWYHSDYTGAPTDGSAWVSPAGSQRVERGGTWGSSGSGVRSAIRGDLYPDSTRDALGLRVVR